MKILIGSTLLIVFFFLAVIHIYWGLGGKWGVNAAYVLVMTLVILYCITWS